MSTTLLTGLRRFGGGFITRMLRHDVEAVEAKKHPERVKAIQNTIAKVRYNKKKKFVEKKKTFNEKFPTRKMRKEYKKEFKLQKKAETERYKTDPVYRLTTVPRATRSEKYDMGASVLRYEAKHGSSIITRTQSARVLKNWILPIYEALDARTWVKPLNPFGRKKRKKFKIELERAKLDLKGDV